MIQIRYQLRAVAAIATLAIPVAVPSTASAVVIDHVHYHVTDSHIEQEEHGADFCPNVEFPVLFQLKAEGMLLLKTAQGPFPYFADRFRATHAYTNTENGKALTQVFVSRNADQHIVDNGDGTITITIKHTGRDFVYGPDGNLLFIDAGQIESQIVIDYNDTPADPGDDEFDADLGVVGMTGRQDTDGRDLCDDLVTFLS